VLQRASFDRLAVVLLLFDLDKFKTINDTFGHPAGDSVLTAFCRLATGALRPGDLFGRLGGEEFAALLPQISLDHGLDVAERIRSSFEATAFNSGAGAFNATVSIGAAIASDGNLSALMTAADRALYRAKANGRNRVEHVQTGSVARTERVSAEPHRIAG